MKYETYLAYAATNPVAMNVIVDRMLSGLRTSEKKALKNKEYGTFNEFCRDYANAVSESARRLQWDLTK